MTTILKSQLKVPYELDLANRAASLFSSVYPFDDAGGIGTQPAIIPDLLGVHDIAMVYGATGSVTSDGALQLADNGNGQTNTFGEFLGIDQTWSSGLTERSRIYLIDLVFKLNTKNYQNLFDGPGILIRWSKSTGELSIYIENISSHRISATYMPADNERIVIGLLINQTTATAHIVVNGVELDSTVNGFPFSGAQTKPSYNPWLGRQNSWNNYYGWDGKLNLFAFGYNFNGNELAVEELIALTNEPYSIFQEKTNEAIEYNFYGTVPCNAKSIGFTSKNVSINAVVTNDAKIGSVASKRLALSTTIVQRSQLTAEQYKNSVLGGLIKQQYQTQLTASKTNGFSVSLVQTNNLAGEASKKVCIKSEIQQNVSLKAYFTDSLIEIYEFNATIAIEPSLSSTNQKNTNHVGEIFQQQLADSNVVKISSLKADCSNITLHKGSLKKSVDLIAELNQHVVLNTLYMNSSLPLILHEFRIDGEIVFQRFNGAIIKQKFNGEIIEQRFDGALA